MVCHVTNSLSLVNAILPPMSVTTPRPPHPVIRCASLTDALIPKRTACQSILRTDTYRLILKLKHLSSLKLLTDVYINLTYMHFQLLHTMHFVGLVSLLRWILKRNIWQLFTFYFSWASLITSESFTYTLKEQTPRATNNKAVTYIP